MQEQCANSSQDDVTPFLQAMLLDLLHMTVSCLSFSFSLAWRRCGKERVQQEKGEGNTQAPPPACRPKLLKMKHHHD